MDLHEIKTFLYPDFKFIVIRWYSCNSNRRKLRCILYSLIIQYLVNDCLRMLRETRCERESLDSRTDGHFFGIRHMHLSMFPSMRVSNSTATIQVQLSRSCSSSQCKAILPWSKCDRVDNRVHFNFKHDIPLLLSTLLPNFDLTVKTASCNDVRILRMRPCYIETSTIMAKR